MANNESAGTTAPSGKKNPTPPLIDKATRELIDAAVKTATEKANKKPSVWDKLDVPIAHEGRAITLPAEPGNMPL